MIFRNDDIRADSDPECVEKIHQVFLKHDRVHTLGLQLEGLYGTPIWTWMEETYKKTPKHIQFALHCWYHRFYSTYTYQEAVADLSKCIEYWDIHRGSMPAFKMFFPPNSLTSPALYKACETVGLVCVNYQKVYPSYVFHWGEVKDGMIKLEDLDRMLVQAKGEGH